MLHRAILGSLERFIGVLIEHVGGAFPLWLAPVQAAVLPVSDKFLDYADEVAADSPRPRRPGRGRPAQREARRQDPRRAAPEGPLHARRRREGTGRGECRGPGAGEGGRRGDAGGGFRAARPGEVRFEEPGAPGPVMSGGPRAAGSIGRPGGGAFTSRRRPIFVPIPVSAT